MMLLITVKFWIALSPFAYTVDTPVIVQFLHDSSPLQYNIVAVFAELEIKLIVDDAQD